MRLMAGTRLRRRAGGGLFALGGRLGDVGRLVIVAATGDGVLELAQAAADRTTGVGKALRSEDYKGDDQYDDKLERSDARHGKPPDWAQRDCADRVATR